MKHIFHGLARPDRRSQGKKGASAQAAELRREYSITMKPLIAALIILAAVVPSLAQDVNDFFGITQEDAQAMIGEAKAQQHEELLRSLGWQPSNLPSVGRTLGWRATLASAQNCVYDAVETHLRADSSRMTAFPDVLYAADVDLSRYQAAYKAQFPDAPVPTSVQSAFMPNYNVIYVDDAAADYKGAATMDAALAAQFARYIDTSVKNVADQATIDADAAAVQSWYQTRYPAGTSSCR
jgi:hypothetical protein